MSSLFNCTIKYHKRNNYGHIVYCGGYANIPKITCGKDAINVFLPTPDRWFCSYQCKDLFTTQELLIDQKYVDRHISETI